MKERLMKKALIQDTPTTSWPKRLLWFIALWAASVCALGIVAYALRLFMRALGLTL